MSEFSKLIALVLQDVPGATEEATAGLDLAEALQEYLYTGTGTPEGQANG